MLAAEAAAKGDLRAAAKAASAASRKRICWTPSAARAGGLCGCASAHPLGAASAASRQPTHTQKAARPIVRESRINRQTFDCLLRVRLIFQGAYSLPELAPRQRMFSTRRRLLGVIGPFPTPVWMSWRAAPCATQSITSAGLARQATISAGGRFPSLPLVRFSAHSRQVQ